MKSSSAYTLVATICLFPIVTAIIVRGTEPVDVFVYEARARAGTGDQPYVRTVVPVPEILKARDTTQTDALSTESVHTLIQDTVFEKVDTKAFFDLAMELSKLEISKTPLDEEHPSGAKRYPLIGTPEGVTAELWIRPSTTTHFQDELLSYHVTTDYDPTRTLAGTGRRKLHAQLALWTTRNGEVGTFAILTEAAVSGRTPGWDRGIIPTGVFVGYDSRVPSGWYAKNTALSNGCPVDLDTAPKLSKLPEMVEMISFQKAIEGQRQKIDQ